MASKLDSNQILQQSFDDATQGLKVQQIAGVLVPEQYDELNLTYVPSGPGAGEIATVVYKLSSVTVATLTLSYDGSNRLSAVVKT